MSGAAEAPSELFQRKLHVPKSLADRLAKAFATVEEVAYVPFDELVQVSGLPVSEAQSLRQTARLDLYNDIQ